MRPIFLEGIGVFGSFVSVIDGGYLVGDGIDRRQRGAQQMRSERLVQQGLPREHGDG